MKLGSICLVFALSCAVTDSARAAEVISLDGEWKFHRSGTTPRLAKPVQVPNPFEVHEGPEFDGVGIYQRSLPKVALGDRRAILCFNGVATQADVFVNGRHKIQHLGGWTPFQVDITDEVRIGLPGDQRGETHVEVRVDEKVGHNSQGFLPVFAPHFGGIWQSVELRLVPKLWLDDLKSFAWAEAETKTWRNQLSFHGELPEDSWVGVSVRLAGGANWNAERRFRIVTKRLTSDENAVDDRVALCKDNEIWLDWKPPGVRLWTPDRPTVYQIRFRVGQLDEQQVMRWQNEMVLRSAFRSVSTNGRKLLLNGKPLVVRGVLNWGWAPPRTAPSIDEALFRKELRQAKAHGFNLMKFCLWVPPKRYLEIADEVGMLTWIEYPTWHSKWRVKELPLLTREFSEFFANDRHHPSVVLRSLTCETGPSANLNVIRSLYDLCHEMIPGSIVEDDSSWIQWNRVHDFYDDHPYGNNHTWPETITRLEDYIGQRSAKPLILGEAIAADTWYDRQSILRFQAGLPKVNEQHQGAGTTPADESKTDGAGADDAETDSSEVPFWMPLHFEDNKRWLDELQLRFETLDETQLRADSLRYALLMRKYQIETYRRMSPTSGYVVSVIRDFPFAEMGILNHAGRPKWPPKQWEWHREIACLLRTTDDRRAFASGDPVELSMLLHHGGPSAGIKDGKVTVEIFDGQDESVYRAQRAVKELATGELSNVLDFTWTAPDVRSATAFRVRVHLRADANPVSHNEWTIWVVPTELSLNGVYRHASCRTDLLPLPLQRVSVWRPGESSAKLVVASNWDEELIDFIVDGGRALVVADGRAKSFATTEHWFLRGGPVIMNHPVVANIGREFLLDLQHFDLAGPVMPNIAHLIQLEPIALLWDNHDIDHVKTHALAFESRMGSGSFVATSFQLTNPAGRFVTSQLMAHLLEGPRSEASLTPQVIQTMREKIDERRVDLTRLSWKFQPDPKGVGLRDGWHRRSGVGNWTDIKVGKAWESQGHANLDGWAWYQIEVPIPNAWQNDNVYFALEGADDYYEVYVNGVLVGQGGDREKRVTAFEEEASHLMTEAVQFGATNRITVRVEDWQGAGGLFRPVWIGTAATSNQSLLK